MEQDLNLIIINSLEGSYISFHESEEEYGLVPIQLKFGSTSLRLGLVWFGLIESLI